MTKINFKKPRYVVPILVFPLLCLLFYSFKSFEGSKEKKIVIQEEGINQFNPKLPSPSEKSLKIKKKFNSVKNQIFEQTGYSVIQNIDKNNIKAITEKPTTKKEEYLGWKKQKDFVAIQREKNKKLKKQLLQDARKLINKGGENPNPYISNNELINRNNSKKNPSSPMNTFQKQMKMIDSMRKVMDPAYQKKLEKKKMIDKKDSIINSIRKPLDVSLTSKQNKLYFNSIGVQKEKQLISAMINQEVEVTQGSRIKIRLLDDIKVGNIIIEKGKQLYGEVSGFSQQRVFISITSIIKNGKILPINLVVYDLDGMSGLYVPDSEFRTFTKQLGANNVGGMQSIIARSGGNRSVLDNLLNKTISNTVSSATKALSKVISKNKAHIKYNTKIHLVNPDNFKK